MRAVGALASAKRWFGQNNGHTAPSELESHARDEEHVSETIEAADRTLPCAPQVELSDDSGNLLKQNTVQASGEDEYVGLFEHDVEILEDIVSSPSTDLAASFNICTCIAGTTESPPIHVVHVIHRTSVLP